MVFFYFSIVSQNIYLHLMEHQCSAENCLGHAAFINNKNIVDATHCHTTKNFPVWQPTII
jgi:hypothetical protein